MIKQRLVTALVLAAGLLAALFMLPATIGSLLFGLLFALGAWEWSGLAGISGTAGRTTYTVSAVLIAVFLSQVPLPIVGLSTLAWIDIVVLATGLVWMLRFPVAIPRAFSTISGLVILPLGWLIVSWLLVEWGPRWVLLLFGLVAAADIGAFFSGRAFGRYRLAPAVSPGKTWEGVIGGLIASAGVGAIGGILGGAPIATMAFLGVLVAAISVFGDLTISMLKRGQGLKDSGSIFPGHGGVLDRVDSLLAALPVYLVGVGAIIGK